MNPAVLTRTPASPAWYDDLCSCLQTVPGCVFEAHGWDPVRALASGWRYQAPATAVEAVEFYHPSGDDLQEQFCLHHPVQLTWHHPGERAVAHDQLRAALAAGHHPVVAVNNFHLPFRPAYHDVHAAHLVLVEDVDDARDEVVVNDPMPPAFRGPLPATVLDRARESLVVGDDSDLFFAGVSPAWRWLEITVEGPQPVLDDVWLHGVMAGNVAALRRDDTGPAALADVLRRLPAGDHPTAEDPAALAWRDVYVLGWPAQAEASLHARMLADAATQLRRPALAELARSVDSVAHAWTGFRIAAARAGAAQHVDPAQAARIRRHGERLLARWDDCLRDYAVAVEQTS